MDFTEGLSTVLIGMRIAITIDPSNRFIADYLRTFFSFVINDDFIRSVNLVIGEYAILKNEPSRSPSFTVIHPLIQYPGDSISDEVVDLHINNHRRQLFPLTTVAVTVAMTRSRIGSNGGDRWWRRRRHGEVRERRRRGFYRRGLVGNSGDAAERMHVKWLELRRLSEWEFEEDDDVAAADGGGDDWEKLHARALRAITVREKKNGTEAGSGTRVRWVRNKNGYV